MALTGIATVQLLARDQAQHAEDFSWPLVWLGVLVGLGIIAGVWALGCVQEWWAQRRREW